MSWKTLEQSNPQLAAFGAERLHGKVAYLATIRKDGTPCVHPMTPIIGEGHFFVFMEPTSPKGHDLRRDGHFAMHCSVSDISGSSGEFSLTGQARLVDDPQLRALAMRICTYEPSDRYVLFEFDIERAMATTYEDRGPVYTHWKHIE